MQQDSLDNADFDPIDFINSSFPTEDSLESLDTFVFGINSQISALDDEISNAVQSQSVAGQQASKEIAEAQQSINELYDKIQDIKAKASQSERMVQEICADIKKLDYAKTHLQSSITALKRLQMLITAVSQLEVLAREYQYREAANLLDAVTQLMAHFEAYTSIPLVADIKARLDGIRMDLKKHVHKAFREIGQLIDTVADVDVLVQSLPGKMGSITEACLVVDSLGAESRKELLEEFVQLQLVPYERLFGPDKQHNSLDQVDRRWAWFKRLLKSVDSKFSSLCPPHWRFQLRLCVEFMDRTKMHLQALLTSLESADQIDVNALIKALQTTLKFEQEMLVRFGASASTVSSTPTIMVGRHSVTSSSPAEAAMEQHLKDNGKLMYVPTDHNALLSADAEESEFVASALSVIKGSVSGVFDKFLGCYVLLERRNLEELLQRLSQEEDTAQQGQSGAAGGDNVFGSSMSMFAFIKNSIKRCIVLTNGQTFLSLTKEFKTCMHNYAEMLRSRCPVLISTNGGLSTTAKLLPGQETTVCYLINTGEYCSEVVPQLEQMIKSKMTESLADRVDMATETDCFMDLVAYAMKVLVSGIVDKLDPAFRTMATINWASDSQVGEESAYVLQCNAVLVDVMPRVRESLASSYFNTVCTKIGTEVLQRYHDVIMRQKKISEAGTQQLLLDTYNLKTLLLHIHGVGADHKVAPPLLFTKLIQTQSVHIEATLKLVGTPEELLLERFRIMLPEGKLDDLVQIMTLKGMKRTDMQPIIDKAAAQLGANKQQVLRATAFTASPGQQGGNGSGSVPLVAASVTGAASLASSAMASSMRNLTNDLSSSARSALKWK